GMSDRSKIEWTDASWNPATGCVEVSEGCDHCYARTFAERFRGVHDHPYEQGFDPKVWPERLEQPLRWKKPRTIFVNSMSDLFQDAVPDRFIMNVFTVMSAARHHVFQVLTKRPGRMASLLRSAWWEDNITAMTDDPRPLPNVWLGTSVENQKWAGVRIPRLLETPAAVRFLSCEPLLGPIDLRLATAHACTDPRLAARQERFDARDRAHLSVTSQQEIGWVIVGGESGPGARAMHPDWARDLRDQCNAAGVPFFFKQWGGRTPRAGGRELDGRTWDEMPASEERDLLRSVVG
ncbi:MAG: phage Gp37/Gp68 family protein, partial [Actinomycetota bacterium]